LGPTHRLVSILVLPYIGINCATGELAGLLELLLNILPFFDVLAKLRIPLLNVIVVEAWRVWHCVHWLLVFALLVLAGLRCLDG
jgi:hypothetical protein